MDCKHEKILPAINIFTCKYCSSRLERKDIVILTKVQHEAREDVVKDVRNTFDGYVTGLNAAPQAMAMIGHLLDALDKGEL